MSPTINSSTEDFLLETKFLGALEVGNLKVVNDCIGKGVNPNCVNIEDGNTPLHIAAESDYVGLALKLLKLPNINLDVINCYGLAPLHISLKYTSFQMLKLLLKNNANVNITDSYGNTPLHTAARIRSVLLAQLLFRYGGNPNISNMVKNTPLHVAVLEMPFFPMVKLLLNHGANVNIESGNMPLFLQAVLYCHTQEEMQILLYLHKKGALANVTDKMTNRNALHYVAMTGSNQLAIQLVKLGINYRHTDYLGKTPLEIARERGNFDLMFIFEHAETISMLMSRTKLCSI